MAANAKYRCRLGCSPGRLAGMLKHSSETCEINKSTSNSTCDSNIGALVPALVFQEPCVHGCIYSCFSPRVMKVSFQSLTNVNGEDRTCEREKSQARSIPTVMSGFPSAKP